ncbi:protein BLISTER-like isoform X2 [Telopea speciosissima]|uniref:protein BLISTER-like isoform X2 n=1 Tax=Telopea speciosissima TaxID=54955 RepID=UPI001CC7C520|nr:protein BLISTER-like isoform X2 [Telopea speciosissima]
MASAQVLPNSGASSRKGHLEAGKRRLEEFRKKRAEGRARKPAPTGQQQSSDLGEHDKQPQESERIRLVDSDGAVTSERDSVSGSKLSGFVTAGDTKGDLDSSNGTHGEPSVSANNYDVFSAHRVPEPGKDQGSKHCDGSGLPGSMEYRIKNSSMTQPGKLVSVRTESDILGFASKSGSGNISTMYEDSIHSRTNSIESAPEVKQSVNASVDFDSESMLSSFNSHRKSVDNAPWQKSVSLSTGYGVDTGSLSDHVSLHSALAETGSRRSRPSFLDSLNVPRVSSESHFPNTELEKAEPFLSISSKIHSVDGLRSFNSQPQHMVSEALGPTDKSGTQNFLSGYEVPPVSNPVHVSNEGEALRQNVKENSIEKKKPEFPLLKHDEDFSALEQHIEDLTQEKFSLQRALDGSRTLVESLAVENSSLTESYNQQGAVVNQLKSDMERLQEEIKAQLLELESVQMDYANAQLECNAADERAKILASEVIGLEEKALRLRSNELKLEKQLENSNAEITSYKKKVSSLEKERQDLQSTIDSLQEEKKILQSKLRKASTVEKSVNVRKTPTTTKDVSTSTEDIGDDIYASVIGENSGADTSTFHLEMQDTASFPLRGSSTSPLVPEIMQFHPSALSAAIPPDQLRMVDNINSLISELALEKEELMRALAVESSQSSKLKDLNKDLSRKLEVQTQKLELLTTQSMASENLPARQSDPHTMTESTVFVDEGDEVVERVLGWVMKLFPGGPSKRRTSKLL